MIGCGVTAVAHSLSPSALGAPLLLPNEALAHTLSGGNTIDIRAHACVTSLDRKHRGLRRAVHLNFNLRQCTEVAVQPTKFKFPEHTPLWRVPEAPPKSPSMKNGKGLGRGENRIVLIVVS